MTNNLCISCIACNSNTWSPDAQASYQCKVRDGFAIVKCAVCGLGRLEPMPSQDELRFFYEDDSLNQEYRAHDSQAYVVGSSEPETFVIERLKILADKVGGAGRILDIGAAQGAFLLAAKQLNWKCTGLELSAVDVKHAQDKGLDVRRQTLHEAGFPDGSFDVVHMSHVLEHLPDPVESIDEIYRILRPGGVIALEVPNEFDDLFGTLREKVLRRPRTQYVVGSPHVYFYTPKTLVSLLRKQKFNVFHSATPRRNGSVESKYLVGKFIRKLIFALEQRLKMGPNIEVYATRP